jgi:hypothetical protein
VLQRKSLLRAIKQRTATGFFASEEIWIVFVNAFIHRKRSARICQYTGAGKQALGLNENMYTCIPLMK